jgi:hypothetical protein
VKLALNPCQFHSGVSGYGNIAHLSIPPIGVSASKGSY